MFLFFFIFTITSLLFLIGLVVWIDEQVHKNLYMPETEEEKLIRSLKLRIADTEWKIKRKNAELNSSIHDANNNTNFGSGFKGQDLQRQ